LKINKKNLVLGFMNENLKDENLGIILNKGFLKQFLASKHQRNLDIEPWSSKYSNLV